MIINLNYYNLTYFIINFYCPKNALYRIQYLPSVIFNPFFTLFNACLESPNKEWTFPKLIHIFANSRLSAPFSVSVILHASSKNDLALDKFPYNLYPLAKFSNINAPS